MASPEVALDPCCTVDWSYDKVLQNAIEGGVLLGRASEMAEKEREDAEFAATVGGIATLSLVPSYEHAVDLDDAQSETLERIFQEVMTDPAMIRLHRVMERFLPGTRQHCMIVSKLAGAMVIRDNFCEEEVRYTMSGAAAHDVGQCDARILEVKKSKLSFAENPHLWRTMTLHPLLGVEYAMAAGLHPNASIIIGGHHFAHQKDRGEPYGVLKGEKGFADEQGRRPDMRRLLPYVSMADVLDAIVKPPSVELLDDGRAYREHEPGAYADGLRIAGKMNVDDNYKVALASTLLAA